MDRIVYVLISNAGGVDGLDHNDKGGREIEASFEEGALEKSRNLPWCSIEKRVVELNHAKKEAMDKLTATDKLVLGLLPSQQSKR